MTEAIQKFTGFDITGKSEHELLILQNIGIKVNETMGKGKLLMKFWSKM